MRHKTPQPGSLLVMPKIIKESQQEGRGGFGRVWKVYNKKYKIYYAMKEMSKARIIDQKCEQAVLFERDLLSRINHPFISNIHFSFQDSENIYLVMDLLTGGDLRYHINRESKFTEVQSKFIIASIVLGLEYCHVNGIIHRDIKPENIILDNRGYIKITDFGIAQIQKQGNAQETSGTVGYMAPEILCSQDHTIAADYFALGVIGYELMYGSRPFNGKNKKEIKENIISKQVEITKASLPKNWSIEAGDIINLLLQRKQSCRLGKNGPQEIKDHPWFQSFRWKELYLGMLEAPFAPRLHENIDKKHCNSIEKIDYDTKQRYNAIMASSKYRHAFDHYSYFNREDKNNINKNDNKRRNNYNNPHIVFELSKECYNGQFSEYISISQSHIPSVKSAKTPLIFRKIHQIQRKSALEIHPKGMLSVSNQGNYNPNILIMNERKAISQKNQFVNKSSSSMILINHHMNKNYSSILNESHFIK